MSNNYKKTKQNPDISGSHGQIGAGRGTAYFLCERQRALVACYCFITGIAALSILY